MGPDHHGACSPGSSGAYGTDEQRAPTYATSARMLLCGVEDDLASADEGTGAGRPWYVVAMQAWAVPNPDRSALRPAERRWLAGLTGVGHLWRVDEGATPGSVADALREAAAAPPCFQRYGQASLTSSKFRELCAGGDGDVLVTVAALTTGRKVAMVTPVNDPEETGRVSTLDLSMFELQTRDRKSVV